MEISYTYTGRRGRPKGNFEEVYAKTVRNMLVGDVVEIPQAHKEYFRNAVVGINMVAEFKASKKKFKHVLASFREDKPIAIQVYKPVEDKVIQILSHGSNIFALTENGRVVYLVDHSGWLDVTPPKNVKKCFESEGKE